MKAGLKQCKRNCSSSQINKRLDTVDCHLGKRQLAQSGFSGIRGMRGVLIEAIRLFLAFASFMGFPVYQMDVKSAFLYGTIEEETIMANSTTEAEYVAAANCCGQSRILSITSRTKHIEIRHHFIRDCYEKRLIDVIKIHTDGKAFEEEKKWAAQATSINKPNTGRPSVGASNSPLANLVLPGKFGAARENFVLFVTVTNFVDQHNIVACLEKIEGNSNFHEIVDFLASSSIHHALTINATVDSKAVVVTEASIRSSILFNDADGTACLTNEAIFQNLALMG
ncbi:putative ribonuclease H-like domain-containing protein, partial [Tanacetum coccineum]